jgi:Glycosyltransferase
MFAPAFPPFANPEAIVNGKLALSFLQAGWHVDIISRNFAEEWKKYNYGSAWIEPWLPLKEHIHIVSYKTKHKLSQLLDTAWSGLRMWHPVNGCRWAAHAFSIASELHKMKPYDIIISRSLPDFGHLPSLAFSKKFSVPWIANWNDASGVKNPPPAGKGPQASLGLFHERFLAEVAREATWHTFPSDRMRSHICRYLKNGTEQRSSTIPHVLLDFYQPNYRGQSNVFTLCYAGNLYAGRDPSVLFQALANFVEKKSLDTRLKVNILGLEEIGLNNLVKKYHLEKNVNFVGPLSYIKTLDRCLESDVLVVLEAPYVEGIYLPSKFVDYVQTGRPILAISPATGTLRDLLSAHGGGIAADCTSVEDIVLALEKLYAVWLSGTLDEVYNSRKLHDLFSTETIIGLYKKIFSEVGIKKKI